MQTRAYSIKVVDLMLTNTRAELTEEHSEQLLSTLIVSRKAYLEHSTKLTHLEPLTIQASIFCFHAEGDLNIGTVFHQAHLGMDSVYSKPDCLVRCWSTRVRR
jgi:hypothetical protein